MVHVHYVQPSEDQHNHQGALHEEQSEERKLMPDVVMNLGHFLQVALYFNLSVFFLLNFIGKQCQKENIRKHKHRF